MNECEYLNVFDLGCDFSVDTTSVNDIRIDCVDFYSVQLDEKKFED